MMNTGNLVVTRGIAARIADNEQFAKQVVYFHGLYLRNDWGDISEDDKEMNDINVQSNTGSLMGAYNTCEGRIWIMTDHDRSVTTILFPDEY